MGLLHSIGAIFVIASTLIPQTPLTADSYLTWDLKTISSITKRMRVTGQVGGSFDFRVTSTDKSYNYKLRATWFTPEMIRACARYQQLRERLSNEQTRALVADAETVGDLVVMVEIDPREGSGVIPSNWIGVLKAKGSSFEVPGTAKPALRSIKALAGTASRDYSYDLFWLVFPLHDQNGNPVFTPAASDAELVVTIHNKTGRVYWPIPESIRTKGNVR